MVNKGSIALGTSNWQITFRKYSKCKKKYRASINKKYGCIGSIAVQCCAIFAGLLVVSYLAQQQLLTKL